METMLKILTFLSICGIIRATFKKPIGKTLVSLTGIVKTELIRRRLCVGFLFTGAF